MKTLTAYIVKGSKFDSLQDVTGWTWEQFEKFQDAMAGQGKKIIYNGENGIAICYGCHKYLGERNIKAGEILQMLCRECAITEFEETKHHLQEEK